MLAKKLSTLFVFAVVALVALSCANQVAESSSEPTAEEAQSNESTTTTSSAPETTTAEPALLTEEILTSYEFTNGLVDGRPSQIQGLLGVPEGDGPFPVAIVMHGSHPACVDDFQPDTFASTIVTETVASLCGADFPEYIRHDIGLGHIVTALNDAGVAAISIDVESAYVWWGGEPNEVATVEALVANHFLALARLNSGEDLGLGLGDLSDRFDLTEVSLVGHSRSGGHVVHMISSESSLPFEPSATVMIQPAVAFPGSDHLDVPVLLIRGECDEDVGSDAGLEYSAEVFSAERNAVVADVFVPAAGHRMLNTGLNGSTCPERGDQQLIQSQIAQAVSSFVATQGTTIDVIEASGATLGAIRGAAPTERTVDALADFDPADVPFALSDIELLPAWPEDADYSDALIEDF